MKITNVTVHLLKATGASRIFDLVLLPGMRRDRWKHDLVSMESGVMPVMRVETDEGIVGVCTADAGASADLTSASLEQLRFLVVGKDPLDRERLYQALHTGTRWLYQPPGMAGIVRQLPLGHPRQGRRTPGLLPHRPRPRENARLHEHPRRD